MRKWLVSAVAAAFHPRGFHYRGVLTLIGGVIGIGLSMVLLVVGKPFMLSENVSLTAPMLVKPGLFISALIFTFLLNILSAGIPAWRTTRQPIVEALKGNE